MDLFREMGEKGHEQVVFSVDPESGLKAVIAIHSTLLGPSLGGCRLWPYKTFDEAVRDALRLSRAMTYKAAVSGLHLGGGKAVILARPEAKTPALLRAFGRAVDSLAGLYFTAEDVGMTLADIDHIREVTRYATGISEENGGSGDPSPMTALGVLHGMRACLRDVWGEDSFSGKTVAIQGVGKVGGVLADLLHREGARLILADLDASRLKSVASAVEAQTVSPSRIATVPCDIFAPCGMGGVLNPGVISRLRCRVVAGAANNPMAASADPGLFQKKGILYAPDYVINAGGLINIACEMEGYNREKAARRVEGIADTLAGLFDRAKKEKITPAEAAHRVAEERLSKAHADRRGA